MRLVKKAFVVFVILFTYSISALASDTIQINLNQYFIDTSKNLVITNADIPIVNLTWRNIKTHILLNEVCEFSDPINMVEAGLQYELYVPSKNSAYKLYFTQLPIVSISTEFEIVDEPDVLANFKMIETNQNFLESNVGIQYRGGWTQSLPKKSMEIEFWKDSTEIETQDFSLLGMVNDDDWNLQAMYNEPLRIRSKTNNDLWRKINTLHYQNLEPEAINGVRMKYVELFINNEYRGLYCLGEKVNRKQLKLKKHNGNIRGELYKGISWGASTFTSLPPYSNNSLLWGGFEYKHPNEEIDWSNLYNTVDFVVNSSNDIFYQGYYNHFDIVNLVDYFIFLNLIRALDNTGKNIYVAKYNSTSKYFYVPWDLDGSFGTIWNGTNDNTTNDILSNGFYNRLMSDCNANGFRNKLKYRWLELRSTVITHDFLISLFNTNHVYLKNNGVYERESLAWTDYSYDPWNFNYMSSWISERIAFLDIKFTDNCIPLSVVENDLETDLFQVYPNPTHDLIYFNLKPFNDYIISVYNQLGHLVLKELYNEPNKSISLGHFSNGLYFIKVENNEHIITRKILLTK